MNVDYVKSLDTVCLVQLDIRASDLSGKVSRDEDLKGAKLPPSSIMSSGVRHYCDPAKKQGFNTARKAAERACNDAGIKLLHGWAVPLEKAHELQKTLKDIELDYNTKVNVFLAQLPNLYREWEEKVEHVEWRDLLRRDRPEPDSIRHRYRFKSFFYRMRPATDEADDPLNESMGLTAGSLAEALLDNLATQASDLLEKHFEGKNNVDGKLVGKVGVMTAKLMTFAKIDPIVMPVVNVIGEVLQAIGEGHKTLDTVQTQGLRATLSIMADPLKLRKEGLKWMQDNNESGDSEVFVAPAVKPTGESDTNDLPLFQSNPAQVDQSTQSGESASKFAAVLI